MKIVHLNTIDNHGGAAKSTYRIMKSLKLYGINNKMVVMRKNSDLEGVIIAKNGIKERYIDSNFRKIIDRLYLLRYKNREKIIFSSGIKGININNIKEIQDADIVHLHWINGSYIALDGIKSLLDSNKKIVWTLHDSWPFTGGCHIRNNCEKFKEKCGNCDALKSEDSNDISAKILAKKLEIMKSNNLTVVTPSNWLGNCAKESSVFKYTNTNIIPNPIDTDIFKPINKKKCREKLGLSNEKIILCFGAVNSLNTPYKGFEYLVKAIKIFCQRYNHLVPNVELLVFGDNGQKINERIPLKINYLGNLREEKLILAYNSSDIFINPSIEDNFPNTTLESMSCGVPNIAFSTGGLIDLINHKENGYIAEYKNVNDFALGIKWCIENYKTKKLAKNARNKVLSNYTYKIIGKYYKNLYEGILYNK